VNLFQIVVAPVLAFSALVSLARARHAGSRRLGGLLWAAIWLAGAGLVLRPNVSTTISSFFGIGRGADFVFYIAVVSGLYALLALYGRLRRLETALTEVVREQAIRDAAFSVREESPELGREA
jgi:hypothetical protein